MKFKHTERGFAYVEVVDTRGCIARIARSSADPLDCVWIFTDDPKGVYTTATPAPHLNAKQARKVAEALLAFANGEDMRGG